MSQALSKDEVCDLLPQLTALVLDTNVLMDFQRLVSTLSERVQRWNLRASPTSSLTLYAPALCWAELIVHQRFKYTAFDPQRVITELRSKNVVIQPYDQLLAERHAEELTSVYTSDGAWRTAKREALGLSTSGKRVSATVDWFVAAHGLSDGALFVTNDKGRDASWTRHSKAETVLEALAPLRPAPAIIARSG